MFKTPCTDAKGKTVIKITREYYWERRRKCLMELETLAKVNRVKFVSENAKYGSSKGTYAERYNHERVRESPNGNSFRSDSPGSESPRDRNYQNKMYVQKIREKERDRDYKSSRDKYPDSSRSPKEKRSRDSEYRTNHDRVSGEEKERITRVGDWSEHVSSSGKKYYYNCKTEVSQWEKPKEWTERERARYKEKEREREAERYSSSRLGHEKHSNARPSNSSTSTIVRESSSKLTRQVEKREEFWNNQSGSREGPKESDRIEIHDRRKPLEGEITSQDMDISPGGSTPTSETNYDHPSSTRGEGSAPSVSNVLLGNALPRLASHPIATATSTSFSPTSSTLAISSNAPPTAVTTSNVPGPPAVNPRVQAKLSEQIETPSPQKQTAGQPTQSNLPPIQVDTVMPGVGEGPPTPTHSENQDCVVDPRKMTSPPSSLSSLQNLSQATNVTSSLQALRQQGPHLTPSLANYYRDDLVNHVRGWPADILEKQAQKLSEEAHAMTSLQCTRVSAELKTARSIVRLTEIQATLQEQRILFLRQQIKTLEELNTQHSFMGDDS